MSTTAATALINWSDLWKIVVAALVGGSGVVLVFGLLLLGVSRGQSSERRTARWGLYALSALCGAFVAVVAAVGVYAMTQKPSSPAPPKREVSIDAHRTSSALDRLGPGPSRFR
jgi:NADH:ubiquinone oxidoreductase subunit 6 (subunit J)